MAAAPRLFRFCPGCDMEPGALHVAPGPHGGRPQLRRCDEPWSGYPEPRGRFPAERLPELRPVRRPILGRPCLAAPLVTIRSHAPEWDYRPRAALESAG